MDIEIARLKAEIEFLDKKIDKLKILQNNEETSNVFKTNLKEILKEKNVYTTKLYNLEKENDRLTSGDNIDEICEIIIEMEKLGLSGFRIGDAVSLSAKYLFELNKALPEKLEMLNSPNSPELCVIDIDKVGNTITVADFKIPIKLIMPLDSINDNLVLVYRTNTGIPDADVLWNNKD